MNARTIAETARAIAPVVASATTDAKNAALLAMAARLEERRQDILAANEADVAQAKTDDLPAVLANRLRFGTEKIDGRIRCLKKIAALPDPVGQSFKHDLRPNGLRVCRVRVPLGVLLMVYEARPHVTVNAGAFCLKSGNAAILRGGSEAKRCNALLGELWIGALEEASLPIEAIQVVSGSHEEIAELLQCDDLIDLVIPRGGKGLIKAVAEQSAIPVIKHYEGVCHVYVGPQADTHKATEIVIDSKTLMPAVCNAAECVLVDASMRWYLPMLVAALHDRGVEVRGCPEVCKTVPEATPAASDDWGREYLDMILAMRVVDGIDAAAAHIAEYGSGHTESIVTEDISVAERFTATVDSGVVLVNASTMFCDGESLGMGAEIGISTDKLHARGPMGLEELTSYKHVIIGNGQVMG